MSEKDPGVRHSWAPVMYTTYFGILTKAANKLGFALAIHGSMGRDFDLIAVPWTESAGTDIQLIEAFVEKIGHWGEPENTWDGPEHKPHGRRAYSISVGAGLYLDVSIVSCTPFHPPVGQAVMGGGLA